ncbi:ABC transporter substrate-binding protein [Methylobacterium nonmethylotrophicum]|uniref:ABC transporter substrate-binding protein n=1 Tax=Methylobacterium nonmethylotrophicum TaxID=1141884 RepID=A0A4Z0NU93_9HYPH|nr:ABC transporter substrate-binding protein [Methylobacterium nonmethylotrophicum]TGE00757.1 ABC transporter substrate-binding protein [Methylobacterium nonmethylotrophicum]
MNRRDVLMLLPAAAWLTPEPVFAGEHGRPRQLAVLLSYAATDPAAGQRLAAFEARLRELGWGPGTDALEMNVRWAEGRDDLREVLAESIVSSKPDVIVTGSTPDTRAIVTRTSTIPVVFAFSGDPVGSGFVASLSRPGRNVTGFSNNMAALGGKWLNLLHEACPRLRSVVILFNPDLAAGRGEYYLATISEAAAATDIRLVIARVRSEREAQQAFAEAARAQSGAIILPDPFTTGHLDKLAEMSRAFKVPAIAYSSTFARASGLMSYGIEPNEPYIRTAEYVDRLLRGERAAELPVQNPTKFKLVLNLVTFAAFGLSIPNAMLARTDEVLE